MAAAEFNSEDPLDLEYEHPELYEELKRFYELDPAGWTTPAGSSPSQASRSSTPAARKS